jgi:hypothetical protein
MTVRAYPPDAGGRSEEVPVAGITTWTPTLTNSGGGGFTTTVQAAQYVVSSRLCTFVLVFTVTAAGGGGYVDITLPFTPVTNAGAMSGAETAVTGSAVCGSITAAGNRLRTYNNGALAVLNYQCFVTGTFEF